MNKRLAAKKARCRFERWMSTNEFRRQLAAIDAEFGRLEAITVSFLGWFRDAWIALAVAEKTGTRQLRLSPQVRYGADFELKLRDGRVVPFQCTEAGARVEGQRKKEYAAWARQSFSPRHDPFKDWLKRRQAIPIELQVAVNRKARNRYDTNMRLVVYLNLGTYGMWREAIERDLVRFTQDGAGQFHSIWVLWSGNLYRCWPNPSTGEVTAFRPLPAVQLGTWRYRLAAKRSFDEIFGAA